MQLSVYSLKKILFEGEAESLNLMTAAGEITVLDHHRPLVSALAPCTAKITDSGKEDHYLEISSGFLEVNSENQVRLIVSGPE